MHLSLYRFERYIWGCFWLGISYLINTSEYCAEVVPQLEQMIQQKMIANLANKVSFETEVDAFMDLAAHCLKVLLVGVMDRLDPAFRLMQSINWGGSTHVTRLIFSP